jgi:hypothetical protein
MARCGAFARTRAGWAAGLALLSISSSDPEKQPACKFPLWTVDRKLLTDRRHCTAKKEFFFLNEQCGNIYENKGLLWKSGREAGMFMKIKAVICKEPESI